MAMLEIRRISNQESDGKIRRCELVEAMRKWAKRNPKLIASERNAKLDNVYHAKETEQKTRNCVYCEKQGHKSSKCKAVEYLAG